MALALFLLYASFTGFLLIHSPRAHRSLASFFIPNSYESKFRKNRLRTVLAPMCSVLKLFQTHDRDNASLTKHSLPGQPPRKV